MTKPPRGALPLAVAGALVAAVEHAGQVAPHASEHPLLGKLFGLSAAAGVGWVLLLALLPPGAWRARVLWAGLAGHLLMLTVGAWSRLPGLGLPGEGVEPPTGPWLRAMAAEALVVAACALLLRQRAGQEVPAALGAAAHQEGGASR